MGLEYLPTFATNLSQMDFYWIFIVANQGCFGDFWKISTRVDHHEQNHHETLTVPIHLNTSSLSVFGYVLGAQIPSQAFGCFTLKE